MTIDEAKHIAKIWKETPARPTGWDKEVDACVCLAATLEKAEAEIKELKEITETCCKKAHEGLLAAERSCDEAERKVKELEAEKERRWLTPGEFAQIKKEFDALEAKVWRRAIEIVTHRSFPRWMELRDEFEALAASATNQEGK